jgi:nucleotide-binding universal stress UspA family protein
MAPLAIISYDDTENDRDALTLGRLLANAGAEVALAYVRHLQLEESGREALEENEAEALLERGAAALGDPDVPRHVIVSASTGEGLANLAEREGADIVVFGSDYRTAAGRVQPGTSAQRLLDGGPAAVALAPAALRDGGALIRKIGVIPEDGDASAQETARTLAAALHATVVSGAEDGVDLLVVGSRPEAPEGRTMVSAATEYAIETASSPVLVVPRGVAVSFRAPAPAPVAAV